jgi:hypothetical protein
MPKTTDRLGLLNVLAFGTDVLGFRFAKSSHVGHADNWFTPQTLPSLLPLAPPSCVHNSHTVQRRSTFDAIISVISQRIYIGFQVIEAEARSLLENKANARRAITADCGAVAHISTFRIWQPSGVRTGRFGRSQLSRFLMDI